MPNPPLFGFRPDTHLGGGVTLNRSLTGRDSNTGTKMQMQRPPTMSQGEYESLSSQEKRFLPDHLNRDQTIDRQVDGKPLLQIRFNQVKEKRSHNPEFGLKDVKGCSKNVVEAEAEKLVQELYDMGFDDENVEWYKDGSYAAHKTYQSINLYNTSTRQVSIYIKRPNGENTFLTTMR